MGRNVRTFLWYTDETTKSMLKQMAKKRNTSISALLAQSVKLFVQSEVKEKPHLKDRKMIAKYLLENNE